MGEIEKKALVNVDMGPKRRLGNGIKIYKYTHIQTVPYHLTTRIHVSVIE